VHVEQKKIFRWEKHRTMVKALVFMTITKIEKHKLQ